MDDPAKPERFTLSRWSRRKVESARAKTDDAPAVPTGPPSAAPAPGTAAVAPAHDPGVSQRTSAAPAPELPPVESLTIESDFTPFLRPEVQERTRLAALKKLFRDPQFNVMDGLDVYIDDYGKSVPIPDDVLAKLAHARHVLDPPKTRVNEQGCVVDVVEEPAAVPKAPEQHEASTIAASHSGSRPNEADEPSPGAEAGAALSPAPDVTPAPDLPQHPSPGPARRAQEPIVPKT